MEVSAPTNSENTNDEATSDAEPEENAPPKNTFKYRSSHPEELIIGNKDSPR
ncbi:hypothetical protein A2U01_0084363 [Trifolium medium]|uniref:Uncharacterized protein n=1 Tax=Trifolium medium TaxID=97028 RepID=A0A392TSL1_9FABA|nr:hypothetical protein [Trifolium medium]